MLQILVQRLTHANTASRLNRAVQKVVQGDVASHGFSNLQVAILRYILRPTGVNMSAISAMYQIEVAVGQLDMTSRCQQVK